MIDGLVAWFGQQLHSGIFAGGAALGLAGGAVAAIHRVLPWLYRLTLSACTTSVSVEGRSALFEPLLLWLHHHPYAQDCRRLAADLRITDRNDERRQRLLFAPARGSHLLFYRGLPVWLERRAEQSDKEPRGSAAEWLHLTALGRDRTLLRHLIEEAVSRFGKTDDDTTTVYGLDTFHDWTPLARIRRRPLSSVIFPEGVVEGLVADAREFLDGAAWHAARGLPWRRGYLLYGPPGTGKTSLVRALAGALDLDLALINLAAPALDDAALCRSLAEAPQRAALLIEDVDAAFSGRANHEAGPKVTFSGLLNAIDGAASQEGHLLFLTTNHIECLDPALIRPGRVDLRIKAGLADAAMARRLFLLFFPGAEDEARAFARAYGDNQRPAAAIQAYLLTHRYDPAVALYHAADWLADRRESELRPEVAAFHRNGAKPKE